MDQKAFELEGFITLKSSLAHGAFEVGATVTPFRREPVMQRDENGEIIFDDAEALSPETKSALRAQARRILAIIWRSKSTNQWTYSQFQERMMVCARMTTTLAGFVSLLVHKMGGTGLIYREDDAQFLAAVLSSSAAHDILELLRDDGERLLLVAQLQAASQARYSSGEGETIFDFDFDAVQTTATSTRRPRMPLVPVYSANALRNAMTGRRGAAVYILDHFGWFVDVPALRALLSGGALQKTSSSDIDLGARRALLDLMPMYGLYGGAFNENAMIQGGLKASKAWPIVAEAAQMLPPHLRAQARQLSMTDIVNIEAYSRREDALTLVGLYLKRPIAIKKDASGDGEVSHGGMVFEREVLVAGTQLYTKQHFVYASHLQLGAWVSAWKTFARIPYLGGASQQGNGHADICWYYHDTPFLSYVDDVLWLSDDATRALQAYDAHLDARRDELQELLGAATSREDGTTAADLSEWQAAMESEEFDE